MQTSYRVSPSHNVFNQTINRALTHFTKCFPMTRHPAGPQFTSTNLGTEVSPDITTEDWDALFSAVTARLTLIAQPQDTRGAEPRGADALALLQGSVLECVQDLEQLHAMARQMLRRRAAGDLEAGK